MDTETEIGFAQLGLGSVLKQYQLAVPTNQREYAWEEKEVRTLFQDFAREISGPDQQYFLGTIVTIPRKQGFLEVVDGQQRLATTAILLSAIRDYLEDDEPELARSIDNDFLSIFDRHTRSRVPRLSLNVDDNDYFRQMVEETSGNPSATRPSHRLLEVAFKEARKQVKNIVSDLDKKDHGNELVRWIDFLETRASVILLRVPNANNAYRMFETLNDRGKRVSQSDLVKNYLFGQSGSRLNEVQQKWSYMRGALESTEDEDITISFLRHSLTIMRGLVRGADVYEAVQEHARGQHPVVTFSSELEDLAYTFVAIQDNSHDRWNSYGESTRRALIVLDQFGINPMRPVLLAIAKKFDAKNSEKAFSFCVSLGVRLMIASSTRTGTVEEGLAACGHSIYSGNIQSFEEMKAALQKIVPSDAQFQAAFENARVSNRKLARYFMRSLEMVKNNENEPWHTPNEDGGIINLEHILPLRPGEYWPKFSEDEIKLYRNRIGNLTLLQASENSKLQSDDFFEKKAIYALSPYKITNQIANWSDWNADSIVDRQKDLAVLAVKAWPI